MPFSPFRLKNLTLKNRIVRSATFEKRADIDGFATDYLASLYKDLAKGGAGLIISGSALVHISGRILPQMICIHNDHYTEKLKKVTEAVHRYPSKIFIQLVHGGRQSHPKMLGREAPLAPSAVHDPSTNITPQEMTIEQIWEIIESFANSARRAMESGFDGIQLHGAHGYLISSFLSPHTNQRDDYWGGDEVRRFHFIEEVYKAIRDETGEQYPLTIKINSSDFINGGLEIQESVRIARQLQILGFDAVEVSGGMYEAGKKTVRTAINTTEQEAYFRSASAEFKKELYIPVILSGGIRSLSVMDDILGSSHADLVALSRPLIREPDLPNQMMAGKQKADCISCNGCMRFSKLDIVRCTQLDK
ncbi:MAG: NADH:flavin oxidoreductase [Dissulfurispiraceae bacterium]|jgi:2,4-dienoyl-CoA reductase-like NADH-dependent reductase (Old Yellow Enzyme family)|nr:NADH:flavin oxidoreductase [Dissulfurispiraceae bacterium]